MLESERNKLLPLNSSVRTREYKALGLAIRENASRQTKLNEHIKYVRKLQNRLQWKDAVLALFGQEGYEQCVVWIEQHHGHLISTRREWAGK